MIKPENINQESLTETIDIINKYCEVDNIFVPWFEVRDTNGDIVIKGSVEFLKYLLDNIDPKFLGR